MMTKKSSLPKNRRTEESPRRTPLKRRPKERAKGLRLKTWSLREGVTTLRLRESLTSTPVPRGENQQTARTATYYLHKYSVVPTAKGDSLPIVHVIHDLINEHNSGRMHHLLGKTTLKKRD